MQAENANALHKSSDPDTDRLQDINEEPHRCIGPSSVKELAKFFTPTLDEEDHSQVNTRTRCKKFFEPKERRKEVRNNNDFKAITRSFKDSAMFPSGTSEPLEGSMYICK